MRSTATCSAPKATCSGWSPSVSARAGLRRGMVLADAPPLVITTDGQRAGAVEQLAAFTRVLGVTLAVAPTPAMLAKALAHRSPGQPVLIDTAGCDPFNEDQVRQLRQLVMQAGADMVVVLPAGLDPAEAADLARAFAALGAQHLLPTRLDAARRRGSVLLAALASLMWSIPWAELDDGEKAGDIDSIDGRTIAVAWSAFQSL